MYKNVESYGNDDDDDDENIICESYRSWLNWFAIILNVTFLPDNLILYTISAADHPANALVCQIYNTNKIYGEKNCTKFHIANRYEKLNDNAKSWPLVGLVLTSFSYNQSNQTTNSGIHFTNI